MQPFPSVYPRLHRTVHDQPTFSQTPVAIAYRQHMVDLLNEYELVFGTSTRDTEAVAHTNALHSSGLTSAGLITARFYAGLKASAKPGIFHPLEEG